jgi:hypothetical protein
LERASAPPGSDPDPVITLARRKAGRNEETIMTTEILLEEVGLEDGQILADSVRQWRADCQAGQFKIGATTFRGAQLDMELIGAQISGGEYFGVRHEVA